MRCNQPALSTESILLVPHHLRRAARARVKKKVFLCPGGIKSHRSLTWKKSEKIEDKSFPLLCFFKKKLGLCFTALEAETNR